MTKVTFFVQPERWLSSLFFLFIGMPLMAERNDQKHDLENMHVTIPAAEYKSSKFIVQEEIKGKTFILGKPSSYNKKGEAHTGKMLQPSAEYQIRSKMSGGSYNITVFYEIDEDRAPDRPQISIGINTQQPEVLELKKKLVNSVRTSFKVKFIKGKQHTVKIGFPTAGVKVREIKIAKALLPKKK